MNYRTMKPMATALALALSTQVSAATSPAFNVHDLSSKISPCQDLNGFVNAKWAAANAIPADKTSWGDFAMLYEKSLEDQRRIVERAARHAAAHPAGSIEQKIGYLYAAGMDEVAINKAGFDPVKAQLARIDEIKTPADITAYIRDSYAHANPVLFSFYGNADYKNSDMEIAYAAEGGIGLPTTDYYSNPDYAKIREAYVAHIAKSFKLTGVDAVRAASQAKTVMAFETRLASVSLSPVLLRLPENQYHFVSIADADKVTPDFEWAAFFKAQGANVSGGFSLSNPAFFAEFQKMLHDVPAKDWQSYLRFKAIDAAAAYLSKPFQQEYFDFYSRTLEGQKQMEPRWKVALETVEQSMGMALGQLYVVDNFPAASKQRAEELVQNLRAVYKTRIEALPWMSEATKQKALEKWASLVPKIGYPDHWRDWSGLTIQQGHYFDNVQAASQFEYDFDVAKIGKRVDRTEWGMTPQTVNAFYNSLKNEIVFPAAILQPPFFDAKADDAINYGGIGAVIGHEMSHGYDDQGSKFDARGNNNNWWADADRKAFEARTEKLAAQFDAYEPLPGKHVNGHLTMGENIADLGGVNVAYSALQMALTKDPTEAAHKIDGYTQDQRFFLNWARIWRGKTRPEAQLMRLNVDSHSPMKFRAIGAPSNMPEFAKAFRCKVGDAMVRDGDKQVKIW